MREHWGSNAATTSSVRTVFDEGDQPKYTAFTHVEGAGDSITGSVEEILKWYLDLPAVRRAIEYEWKNYAGWLD
jgi:hypothetical protein